MFTTYIYHTSILALSEMRQFLVSWKSLIGLILYFAVFFGAAFFLVAMQRELGPGAEAVADGLRTAEFRALCEQLGFDHLPELIGYLGRESSAVWLFQMIGILWYPIFVMLLSFDAVASDVNRGTQRFIIQRASRASYLSSKFVAHTACYLILHGFAVAILYGVFVWQDVALVPLRSLLLYGMMMGMFIAFLAFATLFVSSTCRSAGKALIWIQLFWVVLFIAGLFVTWLNPLRSELLIGLLMPDSVFGRSALFSFGAWSAGLAALAIANWERKEL